ncbi:L-threonylcarbamoyladenylate synthase [Aliihoeflea sp. PC F10.4]
MAKIVTGSSGIGRAVELLAAGEIVAIPTETVYGLAADATSGKAVAKIYEAKGRPRFNPLIVHVADMKMASDVAIFDTVSRKLAAAFWPGPLTIVLPLRLGHTLHALVSAGLDTVGLRMPDGLAHEVIAKLDRPLAAPSANSSGRISPTTAQAVYDDLADRVPLVLDGGATPVGVESTIVKIEDGSVRLLRPGGVAAEDIEAVIGMSLSRGGEGKIEAPGMLASHYAPSAVVRLDVTALRPGEALLSFGKFAISGSPVATRNLSPSGDLREAAANLFSYLAELDASGASTIAVAPIPTHGLGEAINDRLRRAAAPRDNRTASE